MNRLATDLHGKLRSADYRCPYPVTLVSQLDVNTPGIERPHNLISKRLCDVVIGVRLAAEQGFRNAAGKSDQVRSRRHRGLFDLPDSAAKSWAIASALVRLIASPVTITAPLPMSSRDKPAER
jgi:hypothetical protein